MFLKRYLDRDTHIYFQTGVRANLLEQKNAPDYSNDGMDRDSRYPVENYAVEVESGPVGLPGILTTAGDPTGLVVFIDHDSAFHDLHDTTADTLNRAGIATLMVELLTAEEKGQDAQTAGLLTDIGLLARRTIGIIDWAGQQEQFQNIKIGCFGSGTGATAALIAAAERPETVGAIVSCGGRSELCPEALARILAPALLVVGENDAAGRMINMQALRQMPNGQHKALCAIPGTASLFEDPDISTHVAQISTDWLKRYLIGTASAFGKNGRK